MKTTELTKQLRDMDTAALNQELVASLREQFNLRMQNATKQLTQTHQLKQVRRKIARIRTILQDKAGQAS